ncbi:hypothetical protein ABFX02_12G106200 [Erythranthe guttata]
MKQRGPVFVTAFSPLSMIIVAVGSSFILAQKMNMGRIIGAVVIVEGLYLFVWGKKKDGDKSGLSVEDEEKNEQTENVTGQVSSSI